ncbi:RyR domain-containing protein [Rhodococcoides fascians]|uniref:RyR domain-containing protein n=1 Tax=Rhodococcoides fascians TaxID=1828 RepID=UPI0009B8B193|nr:RyR domain-containing protein [Rhodococcus fascians]
MIAVLYLVVAPVVAVIAARCCAAWFDNTPPYDPDRGFAVFLGTLIGVIWPISVPLAVLAAVVYFIASVVHQANRQLQIALGEDNISPEWNHAPRWQTDSAIDGIRHAVVNQPTPAQSHENWLRFKLADGWIYGPEKNELEKTHPCMVPYDQLPAGQKAKDSLFRAIVDALTPLLPDITIAVENFGGDVVRTDTEKDLAA